MPLAISCQPETGIFTKDRPLIRNLNCPACVVKSRKDRFGFSKLLVNLLCRATANDPGNTRVIYRQDAERCLGSGRSLQTASQLSEDPSFEVETQLQACVAIEVVQRLVSCVASLLSDFKTG